MNEQIARFNEVMAATADDVAVLAEKVRALGTDPAALTDEELAKMQTKHVRSSWGGGMCLRDEMFWPCDALQLIAALRASRAEVERLRDSKEALVREVKRLQDRVAVLSPGYRP